MMQRRNILKAMLGLPLASVALTRIKDAEAHVLSVEDMPRHGIAVDPGHCHFIVDPGYGGCWVETYEMNSMKSPSRSPQQARLQRPGV